MACSVHAQFPTGKPVDVSVNGVAIARDAIVREMQHHPAPKPIAAWQQAARALVIRELLLQRARHLGVAPEPTERRRRPARDRRRSDDPRADRARGHGPRAGRGDLPALLRTQPGAVPLARHLRSLAHPVCRTSARPREPMRRRARTPQRSACRACRERPIASPSWRGPIRAVRRRRRAAISARSRPGRRRRNSSGRLPTLEARRAMRGAGCDPLRISHHPARPQARGPRRCPMKRSPAASPTTCAKACGGAPTHNTSRGW